MQSVKKHVFLLYCKLLQSNNLLLNMDTSEMSRSSKLCVEPSSKMFQDLKADHVRLAALGLRSRLMDEHRDPAVHEDQPQQLSSFSNFQNQSTILKAL